MANAGCINAIWFDWTYLRTLDTLDSANIGVGVQYCIPAPLDDKRLDYIKYTDKCGCTCCITGENEILVYATNWVIKNFTLTNDDTNEVVNVKWNDLFGSNRAYTMVRYKTWSYPTSITDWTLAVKETTQNQYSVSWYNVSGLTDWTTYYFTAFAVSQDGTIIVVQNKTIKAEFFPNEYQKVLYLKWTWSQYIDLWLNYNNCPTPIVELRFRTPVMETWLMWFRWSNSKWRIFWNSWTNWSQFKFTSQSAWTSFTWITADANWHTFHNTQTKWYIDETAWYDHSATMWTSWYNMWLFKTNNYNPVSTNLDIAYCKISKPDWTVMRELIPCFRKSDWVAWMRDKANKVFYTNSWSWKFWVWPLDKITLPDEYQRVEYIRSSSWTQFINTWINVNNCALPIIQYQFATRWQINQDKWLLWNWTNTWYIFWVNYNWRNFAFCGRSSWWRWTVGIWYSTWIHIFTTSDTKWYLDWTQWPLNWWNMYIDTGNTWNLTLFKADNFGTFSWNIDVYYCKISNTWWTVLREFVPCYRKSDNVIGMYDLTNNQFYTNAWSWTFWKWDNI